MTAAFLFTAPTLASLRQQDHPALPPGFLTAARQPYPAGLRYYYADAADPVFHIATAFNISA